MKIGVIGSGDVAKVLASGFLKHGHSVVIGTRDPAKLKERSEQNPGAHVGSFSDAAAFGEVIVLAVKGLVASEADAVPEPRTWRGSLSLMQRIPSPKCLPKMASCSFSAR